MASADDDNDVPLRQGGVPPPPEYWVRRRRVIDELLALPIIRKRCCCQGAARRGRFFIRPQRWAQLGMEVILAEILDQAPASEPRAVAEAIAARLFPNTPPTPQDTPVSAS